jgi:peptidoglycan/LPS O-acetylase OafA/YrhL
MRYVFWRFLGVVHTLGAISDMAIGGMLAWLAYVSNDFVVRLENLSKVQIIFIYAFLLLINIVFGNIHLPVFIAVYPITLATLFVFLIVEQNFCPNSLLKWGRFGFLDKWGKYTYGLYCLHYVGIYITLNLTKFHQFNHKLWVVLLVEPVFSLIFAIVISYCSFEFFESYFLKLKTKFNKL